MKKSDLKTGMWVETRDGYVRMVLMGTSHGDLIGSFNLDCYTDNLKWSKECGFSHKKARVYDYDIIKVYQPKMKEFYGDFDENEMNIIAELNEDIGDISIDLNKFYEKTSVRI